MMLHFLFAALIPVTSPSDSGAGTLRQALADANPGDMIELSGISGDTITLDSVLSVTNAVTIQNSGGSSVMISGDNSVPIFYVTGDMTMTSSGGGINLIDGLAQGGSGGTGAIGGGGGGGGGMGGAIFIEDGASASLSNTALMGNFATGGNGGSYASSISVAADGGGGGNGGSAGSPSPGTSFEGGGGGGGGGWGLGNGGGGGGDSNSSSGGDGGSGSSGNGGNGASSSASATPPTGGGGGGGGTIYLANSASAGIFGGGGGGSGNSTGNGGDGGFGGGGGGTGNMFTTGGTGGYGGGNGANVGNGSGGGGGAALGGAVFVRQGGSLTLDSTVSSAFTGNQAMEGTGSDGGGNGTGYGPDLFLNSGGSLTLNISTDAAFNVVIAGDTLNTGGGLTKTGSATLTLGGTNTYEGNTTISSGTLSISSQANISGGTSPIYLSGGTLGVTGNTTLSGTVNVTANSGIQTGMSATTSLTGSLIGSNGVTLTLSGSGTTEIPAVTVNGSDQFTISGTIGNSGSLTKLGTGSASLLGPNTYTGSTIISEGVLLVPNDDALGSSSSAISLEGGSLSAEGTFTLGAGRTITTTSSSSGIGATSGSKLTIDQAIGGTEGITKIGAGTLFLNGTNTYPGTTVVAAGILGGTGTLGTVTVQNGGTLAPGNSPGVMTTGPVTFEAGSVFQVEIEPLANSLLIVDGLATLAGTVSVVQDSGSYTASGSYEILEATSIDGAFSPTVSGGLPGYSFTLNQEGNNLFLLYTYSPPLPSPTTISTSGLYGNALILANYLNQNASSSTLLYLNDLTTDETADALNSLSPARNAFGPYVIAQTTFTLTQFLSSHIDQIRWNGPSSSEMSLPTLMADRSETLPLYLPQCGQVSWWIAGFGEFAHQSAGHQSPSFNAFSESVLAGLDYVGARGGLLGWSLGYAHSHYDESSNQGHGDIDYYFASLYGDRFIGHFYFSPALWGMFTPITQKRNISFPGFSETARAQIFAWQIVPHLEIGYDICCSWGNLVPFSALDWPISWQRDYNEQGAAPFNAHEGSKNPSVVYSETGFKFSQQWETNWGSFILKEKASYIFVKPFHLRQVQGFFVGTPGTFTVIALPQTLNLGAIGLDFLFAIGKNRPLLIDLDFAGQGGEHYWSNQLMLTFSKQF